VNYDEGVVDLQKRPVGFTDDGERIPFEDLGLNQKFPVFKPKDKEVALKQRFAVPLAKKDEGYDQHRPAPVLGMRTKTRCGIVRPLHDPAGEFAIVLYDPTVDDKPPPEEEKVETEEEREERVRKEEEEKRKSKVHKSLASILGLDKKVEE